MGQTGQWFGKDPAFDRRFRECFLAARATCARPTRNTLLLRETTSQEQAFLDQGGFAG